MRPILTKVVSRLPSKWFGDVWINYDSNVVCVIRENESASECMDFWKVMRVFV